MVCVKYTIVGAGAVGLATAAQLGEECVILERNPKHGMETSSRNSGVIHRGFFYPMGSNMATMCTAGYEIMKLQPSFRYVPKIVLGSDEYLAKLLVQARDNGIYNVTMIGANKVTRLEPHIRNPTDALYSPKSGMIDQHEYMNALLRLAKESGSHLLTDCRVTGIDVMKDSFRIHTSREEPFETDFLFNCAGREADTIAEMAGLDVDALGLRQSFCKGIYFTVAGSRGMLSHLVYTENDKLKGTLGVHATPGVDNDVRLGPNAFYVDRSILDRADRYSVGDEHFEEFLKEGQVFDFVTPENLQKGESGIRAVLQKNGGKFVDFYIERHGRAVHNIGICSPGLTSSPAIGQKNAEMIRW